MMEKNVLTAVPSETAFYTRSSDHWLPAEQVLMVIQVSTLRYSSNLIRRPLEI